MRLATPVTAKKTRLPAGAGRAYRKSKRRARGAFCTPPDVADLLARLARGLMTAGPARAGRVLTVLDPACGCGALLAAAARAFPRRRLLLLGIESDRAAAQAAREALAGVGSRVKVKIAVADALRPEPDGRGSEREEPWAARAADLVILNPPFLSYSGREAAPLTAAERAWMRRRFASFRRGWACAHAVFLELALGAARPGGVVAAVLPGQVAFLRRYQPLREAVLHAADRVRVLPLGEGRFPGVVSPTMLLAARVGCRGRGVIIEHFDPGGRRVATGRFPRPDDAVAGAAFLPPVDAAAAAGMRRAPSAGAALLGGAVRDAGVHTGNVARLILADGADAGADQGGVPLIEGRDVVPFHVLPARKRLRVNAPLPAGGYCRVAPPDRYGPGKVLVRQTAGWPVAAVDREGRCFRNSCLAIYPPEGLPAHFLAAWLNSSPARRLWREMFPESRQRAFPQVKVGYLRALPVPRADAPTRRRLAALARRIEAGLALLTPEAAARLARDGDSPGANSPAGAAFRDQAVARRVRAARAEIDRLFAALVGA